MTGMNTEGFMKRYRVFSSSEDSLEGWQMGEDWQCSKDSVEWNTLAIYLQRKPRTKL